eukprot:650852-Heterocapsa_arctica.AAC.1
MAEAPALEEQKDRKEIMAKGRDGKELHVVIRMVGEHIELRKKEVHKYVQMMKEASGIQFRAEATGL